MKNKSKSQSGNFQILILLIVLSLGIIIGYLTKPTQSDSVKQTANNLQNVSKQTTYNFGDLTFTSDNRLHIYYTISSGLGNNEFPNKNVLQNTLIIDTKPIVLSSGGPRFDIISIDINHFIDGLSENMVEKQLNKMQSVGNTTQTKYQSKSGKTIYKFNSDIEGFANYSRYIIALDNYLIISAGVEEGSDIQAILEEVLNTLIITES